MRCPLLAALLSLVMVAPAAATDPSPLLVHEWGTFTSLQDETGHAIGRINTDDEPVPSFVHQVAEHSLFPPTAAYLVDGKGVPAGNPDISMRLETPVLYFHLPPGASMQHLDVDVTFHGGWLSQYFPEAHATIEGATRDVPFPPLTVDSLGHLSWHDLSLNTPEGTAPQTSERVWTAPRAVESAPVTAGKEREQFLFYRGVGHVDSPLRIRREGSILHIEPQTGQPPLASEALWLVDIRPDGALAFREIPRLDARRTCNTSAEFAATEYATANLAALRRSMHHALTTQGLFAGEADALLNTWESSYFKNPGARLFVMVPPSWTEAVLPLKLSVPAKVTRVMVGRIELITPHQRSLLQHMAESPQVDLKEVAAAMVRLQKDPERHAQYNALAAGRGNLQELGVPVPALYQDFLAMGRFRTALLFSSPDPKLLALASEMAQSP